MSYKDVLTVLGCIYLGPVSRDIEIPDMTMVNI